MPGERVCEVMCDDKELVVRLANGRVVRVPLAWFTPLACATPAQRARSQTTQDGYCIHWPDIGFEVTSSRLLRGPIID
jgi:hypothetical protein